MKSLPLLSALLAASIPICSIASPTNNYAPEPTPCVVGKFTKTGDNYWSNVSLTLTNTCGKSIDLQNSSVTFRNANDLSTSFWGVFGPISYPDNALQIRSQPDDKGFTSSLSLHMPAESWANSHLPDGQSITIQYGIANAAYDPDSVKVYLNDQPIQSGELDLTNTTSKPARVTQDFVWVDIVSDGNIVNKVQLPWGVQKPITGLIPKKYTLQPESVSDSAGDIYQGSANPVNVTIIADKKASSMIQYAKVIQNAKINISAPAIPNVLAGYTKNPLVTLTRKDTGATLTKEIPWKQVTPVDHLPENVIYSFTSEIINFHGNKCTPSFQPLTLISKTKKPDTTRLSYHCVPVQQDTVPVNISGLPDSVQKINVKFAPNDGSSSISKDIDITDGKGSDVINLTDGVIYNVSGTEVSGYSASFNPQPLTATKQAKEVIQYQKASGGKIIAYLPGWVDPRTLPTAAALHDAGYTHIIVAFGLFSTLNPGEIVGDFPAVTADYVNSLHQAGIKVLLSLGGASSGVPSTSVDFHEVVQAAGDPKKFQDTFVASVKKIVSENNFDGIDIDIEHGLGGGSGTFAHPQGDILVLANILNQLHADNPSILISMAPQAANIGATSGFDATWGNYASLIMQTHDAISWVGIQNYNTGCVYGVDHVCYANEGKNPDFSVALAGDLLENWPEKDQTGRATGFQPYVSYLRPDQIVLGYPAPNKQGISDGGPITPTPIIKQAVQCLRTGTEGCATYKAPKAYPGLGGVFEWEVTYDQNNDFNFAKQLKSCVLDGNCQ